MKVRANAVLMLVTPLLSFGTLGLGLRVGAYSGVRAATLFVEPPARGAPTTYLQLLTFLDESGVKEAVGVADLRATFRARGVEHAWAGKSEDDGFAIVGVDLPPLTPGEHVDVEVTAASERGPLLRGSFAWPDAAQGGTAFAPSQLPGEKPQGEVRVTLAIPAQRLTVEAGTPAWVRTSDSAGRPVEADVQVTPEPGLEATVLGKCPGGLTELSLVALFHHTGLGISVRTPDGKTGAWFGSVPVAPGALKATFPRALVAGAPLTIEVARTNARITPYVEVYDRQGRAFAARALGSERDKATLTTPPLEAGPHWLVVAGEPKSALAIEGATVAHPFLVGESAAPTPCELAGIAQPAALRKARIALDGLPSRRVGDARKKRLGLALALSSLAIGAFLEVFLLLTAARESRREIERALREASGETLPVMTKKTSAGSIIVGLLLAVLGFGLLASFLLWRG